MKRVGLLHLYLCVLSEPLEPVYGLLVPLEESLKDILGLSEMVNLRSIGHMLPFDLFVRSIGDLINEGVLIEVDRGSVDLLVLVFLLVEGLGSFG